MPRAKRICAKPGCPAIATSSFCPEHQAEAEKKRGNSNARGYGVEHQRTRARINLQVQAGGVECSRCHKPIIPGQAWHLDHDDTDRGKYLGPSHAWCNTSAGGRKAHTQPTL